MLPPDHAARLQRFDLALDGLSVGDALGDRLFDAALRRGCRLEGPWPPAPWYYTDDTELALGLRAILNRGGRIDQDGLAEEFARRYQRHPGRGFGAGSRALLRKIAAGRSWREASPAMFGGEGSLGNGAAMRVGPLGAYFADDLGLAAEQARLSAQVTHFHPEAVAGAIAVAVAAAWSWQRREAGRREEPRRLLAAAAESTPSSRTRDGILQAMELPPDTTLRQAARQLGRGRRTTAPDTVPFCLWSAATQLDDFPRALWNTWQVGGDLDTNGAIVGSLVALSVGREAIPAPWLAAREPLEIET